jgi:Holliday junction resolvase RusA-like endonuclease
MTITSPLPVIDTSRAPFALPAEIVIDLPFPPSVNRIWRGVRRDNGRSVMLSPEYRKWKDEADALAMLRRACRDGNRVVGPFEAAILLNMEAGRGDIDNRIKAVLDWLQSRRVIENDSLCMELSIKWALPEQAPDGCRVTVKEIV